MCVRYFSSWGGLQWLGCGLVWAASAMLGGIVTHTMGNIRQTGRIYWGGPPVGGIGCLVILQMDHRSDHSILRFGGHHHVHISIRWRIGILTGISVKWE